MPGSSGESSAARQSSGSSRASSTGDAACGQDETRYIRAGAWRPRGTSRRATRWAAYAPSTRSSGRLRRPWQQPSLQEPLALFRRSAQWDTRTRPIPSTPHCDPLWVSECGQRETQGRNFAREAPGCAMLPLWAQRNGNLLILQMHLQESTLNKYHNLDSLDLI